MLFLGGNAKRGGFDHDLAAVRRIGNGQNIALNGGGTGNDGIHRKSVYPLRQNPRVKFDGLPRFDAVSARQSNARYLKRLFRSNRKRLDVSHSVHRKTDGKDVAHLRGVRDHKHAVFDFGNVLTRFYLKKAIFFCIRSNGIFRAYKRDLKLIGRADFDLILDGESDDNVLLSLARAGKKYAKRNKQYGKRDQRRFFEKLLCHTPIILLFQSIC